MVTIETLREIALSFPETTEEPHFEKISFRVKKKIFATYDTKNSRTSIKLNAIDQDVFSSANISVIYPVNNKWGKQGWTLIEMLQININVYNDAITTAYCEVVPKILAQTVRPGESEGEGENN